MANIKEQAMALLKKEEAAKAAEAEKLRQAALAEAAEQERRAAEARILAAAERQQALLRAERLEAEAAAAAAAAEEKEALQKELHRLRMRTPLQVLQDEVAEMRAEMQMMRVEAELIKSQQIHLRQDGFLDMRFKTSKDICRSLKVTVNNCSLRGDPAHGCGKKLWVVYKINDQIKEETRDEHADLILSGPGLTIISAIWRGCCFGGRVEGYGPRTVPLSQDNPYSHNISGWAQCGEADVTQILNAYIV
jgi:hypothetical protein